MKKIFLAAVFLLPLFSFASKDFEGVISYDIKVDGLPPEQAAMMADSKMTVYLKGDKSRTEMDLGFQSTISFGNSKDKTSVVCMDIMGSKYMIKNNEDTMKKKAEKNPPPVITYVDETKEIAGYKCKKANMVMKDDNGDNTVTVWYTEDITANNYNTSIKGIKGYPLQFEQNRGGMKITFTASKISKESVPDEKFVLPDGYKETTEEELKSMFSGGGNH